MPTPTYTRADLGCWIDGTFGVDHAVQKVATMLWACDGLSALHRAFAEEADDAEVLAALEPGEWLDDATEALYDYTEPGLAWLWDAGDLILTEECEDI